MKNYVLLGIAILGGVYIIRRAIKGVDKKTIEEEEIWASKQLAKIFSRRMPERTEKEILEGLLRNDKSIFPSDFKNAFLQYEQSPSTYRHQNIDKVLFVSFVGGEEVSVKSKMNWTSLPKDIRNEILSKDHAVQRHFSF